MFDISEFADKLIQDILKNLYDGLYGVCGKLFATMFDKLNSEIENAAQTLTQTPETWSPDAYSTVKTIAENAFVPIASCFIACILAWQLVHLMQESNQMGDRIIEKLIVLLISCAICVYLCSNSFDIVMWFFKFGAKVTDKISGSTVGSFQMGPDALENFLPQPQGGRYTPMMVIELMGDLLLLGFGNIAIMACGVIIYIRVSIWFLEFLIYASAASIPNATWMNREWSQVGMNYTRKMLAVAFEGPFMLLLFAIYGGVVSGIDTGNFAESVIMIIGCGFALLGMMFKTGNISSSIFNAH